MDMSKAGMLVCPGGVHCQKEETGVNQAEAVISITESGKGSVEKV